MMNSQDKPVDRHQNQDVVDLLKNNNEANNQNTPSDQDVDDLWLNESESLSLEAVLDSNNQSSEDPLAFLETEQPSPKKSTPDDFDLELSELDFRNPPMQDEDEFDEFTDDHDSEIELEVPAELGLSLGDFSDLDELEETSLALDTSSNTSETKLPEEETASILQDLSLAEEFGEESPLENNLDESFNLDDLMSDDDLMSNSVDIEEQNLELDHDSSLDNLLESAVEDLELELDITAELDHVLDVTPELSSLENLLDANLNLEQTPVLDTEPTPEVESAAPPLVNTLPSPKIPNTSPAASKAKVFDQTMRVSVRKLDNLNNLIGELIVKRNRLEEDQDRLRRFLDNLLSHVQSLGEAGSKMHDMYERSLLEGALIASRQSSSSGKKSISGFMESDGSSEDDSLDALEMDRFTGFHLLSQDIIELIVRVREAASDIQFVVDETEKVTRTFRQVTSQLQEGMNSSRMVPFGQTADRLPRAIRDISRKMKKQAELHVEGKEVLIDKMIVEHLYNPMTHLVNNAISHGIESPENRLANGKSAAGQINIRAFIQGNQTVISVSDDGAGINPDIVLQKAVEKKLLTVAQAQNLSKPEIYELLFHPGFSTKDQADDFAGRGVGMDVVSTDLGKIRGTISIESEIGKGTTFTIRLPLVLSICKALTCVYDNTQIAFPIDGVEDTKEYLPSDIQTNENGVKFVLWNGQKLTFQPLSTLLSYNRQIRRSNLYSSSKDEDMVSIIILNSADNLIAVEVDKVKGEQEIVIKQIEGPIPKPPGIAGATVLGDGTIIPIGDVLELIEIAQGKRTIDMGLSLWSDQGDAIAQQTKNVRNEPLVLVVDDSITVRELLSLSFNKLGYRVEQARDGQEAWDKLRGGLPCDMIFCDIEMPRMNGLELLSNLQKDQQLKLVPVAMLTSRGAEKHRQLATDLGAEAYLTKPYTEKELMDVAQRLIQVSQENKQAEVAANSPSTKQDSDLNSPSGIKEQPLVLIIDDSVTVRELLSMTFKKAGYRVEQARDGQEAWDKLSSGLDCDLAFCDIEMPRMNGLELLSELQQDERLSQIPIAMLTSRGAQKMRNIAAKRGATGYFVKPYVEDTLLEAAEKMIKGEVLIDNVED